jgi:cysteinyl-tRNA synthetase
MVLPDLEKEFIEAMDDDFNTVLAVARIGSVFKTMNDLISAKKPKMKMKIHALVLMRESLKNVMAVLGIGQESPEKALKNIQEYLIKAKNVDMDRVHELLEQRETARTEKNWARADEVRDQLQTLGIAVMDTPGGTQWQVLP